MWGFDPGRAIGGRREEEWVFEAKVQSLCLSDLWAEKTPQGQAENRAGGPSKEAYTHGVSYTRSS